MARYIFDIEGDSLTPTLIHVLSFKNIDTKETVSLYDYDDLRKFLLQEDLTLIGHYIVLFDIPVLEKLLGIKTKARLIDTEILSRYLFPTRASHNLEQWGEDLGIKKVEINDWVNLSREEYTVRCETDVSITERLWNKIETLMNKIYENNHDMNRMIDYLTFKRYCMRLQAESRWRVDRDNLEAGLKELMTLKEEKFNKLFEGMPRVPVKAKRTRPKVPFKQDGSPSEAGQRWFSLLREHNLPEDYNDVVEVIVDYKTPNPNSTTQVKEWLFSLGWKPTIYKHDRNKKTNELKSIPQLRNDKTDKMCENLLELAEEHPILLELTGYSTLGHRIPFIQGMLKNSQDGFITAGSSGITNTLRFIHEGLVNLPKPDRPFAGSIRSSLLASTADKELCGSDMSGLEDRIKQHFLYKFDPEYVEELNNPDYDAHLDLAQITFTLDNRYGLSPERVQAYKDGDKKDKRSRDIFKNGNYSCQYGARPKRIALTCNVPEAVGQLIFDAYWNRNWSINKVVEEQIVKEVEGQLWLFNPIAKFWYSLRYRKDIFSTLVQGTASYVFDRWVENVLKVRPQLTAQFHDEIVLDVLRNKREECEAFLRECIKELNDELNLNRSLDIDVQFGDRYSDIH